MLRANKELAAYFHGQRTEREARSALKIIKAFIRDRERSDPASRRPLPLASAKPAAPEPRRPRPAPKKTRRRRPATEPPPEPAPSAEPGDV